MAETSHENTKSTHCRDVDVVRYSNRTGPFYHHIYFCQIIATNVIVLRVGHSMVSGATFVNMTVCPTTIVNVTV